MPNRDKWVNHLSYIGGSTHLDSAHQWLHCQEP